MKEKVMVFLFLLLGFMMASPLVAEEMATRDECMEMCKKAAQVMKEKGGEEVLRQVSDPKGPFVWKDSYVFVIDVTSKKVIAHPIKPGLIGKDMSGIKDVNGKLFFVEFINLALEKGSGWVDYMWPKPNEQKSSPKSSFVYRLPDEPYVFIAGVHN